MLLTAESPLSKLQNGIFRKPICHAFLTTDDADAIGDTPDDQILLNTDYADLHGCATRMTLMTRLSDYFQEKPKKHECLQACIPHGVFQRSGVFLPEGVASRRMACAVRQRRGGSLLTAP